MERPDQTWFSERLRQFLKERHPSQPRYRRMIERRSRLAFEGYRHPCCRPDSIPRATLLALRYGPSDPRNRLPGYSPKPASDGGAEIDPDLFADLRAYPIGRRLCPASRVPAAQRASPTGHPPVDRRKRSAGLPESRTPGTSLETLQITNFSITFQVLQP